MCSQNINQVLVSLNIGELISDCREAFIPEWHGVHNAIRFCGRGHVLPSLARKFKSVAHHPITPAPGEYRFLHRHFSVGASVQAASDLRVFPFVVLTNNKQVNLAGFKILDGGIHPFEQARRSQIDILLECPAYRDE